MKRVYLIIAIMGLFIIGAICAKILVDNRIRHDEALARFESLRRVLAKTDKAGNDSETAHKRYVAALKKAEDAGQMRHDDALSDSPSSEKEQQLAIAEQSGIVEATKYARKELEAFETEADVYRDLYGVDATRRSRTDIAEYRESRIAALTDWETAVNEIVDTYKVGHELNGVPTSAIRETYEKSNDKMSRANKYENASLDDSRDLLDRFTTDLRKSKADAGLK